MIVWTPSPNFTPGRPWGPPAYIVDHWTVGGDAGTHARFEDPDEDASAHYIVHRDGTIHQFVLEKDTAWHAGSEKYNYLGVGIEHEHIPGQDWPEAQMAASAKLHRAISRRWDIPLIRRSTVFGHRETGANTACPGDLDIGRLIGGTVDQETKNYIDERFKAALAQIFTKLDSAFHETLPTELRRIYWHIDPMIGNAPVRLP